MTSLCIFSKAPEMSLFTVEETRNLLRQYGLVVYKNWRVANDEMRLRCLQLIARQIPRFSMDTIQRRFDYLRKIYLYLKKNSTTASNDSVEWEYYLEMDEIFKRIEQDEDKDESDYMSFSSQQEEFEAQAMYRDMMSKVTRNVREVVTIEFIQPEPKNVALPTVARETFETHKLLHVIVASHKRTRRLHNASFEMNIKNYILASQLVELKKKSNAV